MSIYDDKSILIFCTVVAAVLGAVFGSFLNCAAWRIAHGESFLSGKSKCPKCGHDLSPLDLFPVLSWIFLRGKCRYCKAKVSVRYPLTELFFAAVTVSCLLRFDLTVKALANYIFLCCLFCLSLVDLDSFTIPNVCLIIPAAAWVCHLPFARMTKAVIAEHILAAVIFGGGILVISLIMDKVLKKESMGGGDIKLFALVGLYLGILPSLFAVILSCIFGLLFSVIARADKKNDGGQIPFGPSIAAAAAIMLLSGDALVSWYLKLIGI